MTIYTEANRDALIDAVRAAEAIARIEIDSEEIEIMSHLMAQKYEHDDGEIEWIVRFADRFDRGDLTHLSDSAADCEGGAEEIAARIEGWWDDGWTEVPADPENPVSGEWLAKDPEQRR